MNVHASNSFPQANMGGQPDHIRKNQQSTDFKSRTDDPKIHAEDKQHIHEERGKLAEKNKTQPEQEHDATGEA